jgi:hypothetical protein
MDISVGLMVDGYLLLAPLGVGDIFMVNVAKSDNEFSQCVKRGT